MRPLTIPLLLYTICCLSHRIHNIFVVRGDGSVHIYYYYGICTNCLAHIFSLKLRYGLSCCKNATLREPILSACLQEDCVPIGIIIADHRMMLENWRKGHLDFWTKLLKRTRNNKPCLYPIFPYLASTRRKLISLFQPPFFVFYY